DRRVREKVRDAHSLYLETLGELGLVGLALLLVVIGALAWSILRARVRPVALPRAQVAAVGAAFAAWAVHAAADWDWQVPALTGLAMMLAAATMAVPRSDRVEHRG